MIRKRSAIVLLIILLHFTGFSQNVVKINMPDTVTVINNGDEQEILNQVSEANYEKQLLLVENTKLENDISTANRIIENQNSQLEQTNDLLQMYGTIITIVFAFVTVCFTAFGYIVWIRPIVRQKDEVEKLNAESKRLNTTSKDILSDINGTLKDVVESRYREFERKRFDKALGGLNKNDMGGIPILKELFFIGVSPNFQSDLIQFLENHVRTAPDRNGEPGRRAFLLTQQVVDIFSVSGRNVFFEEYLISLCDSSESDKYDHLENIFQASMTHYFVRVDDFENKDCLIKVFTHAHKVKSYYGEYQVSYRLFNLLFSDSTFNSSEEHKKLINDDSFVEVCKTTEIIDEIKKNVDESTGDGQIIYKNFGLSSDSKLKAAIEGQ